MEIIYRQSDRLYAGACSSPAELPGELVNIVHSELGGVVSDYASVTVPALQPGKTPVVHADLSVSFTVPLQATVQLARRTRMRELRIKADARTDAESSELTDLLADEVTR